jgi:glycosyltransferase involved in cell wall biosynthesis
MKKGVDRLVVVSDELEREVRERIGLTPPKLCCVYNGVDTDYYSGHKNGEYRMPLEGLNGGGPVIGTVGNIRHIKGHDIFLHTARLLVNRYPEAKFVVVGDTFPKNREYRNYLLGLKRELGLDRNVEFAGSVHDTSEVFPLFDIFVLPSRSEGLSLSLLEAMSSERPIVATAVGGNSKLIEHGKTGFLAPPEDAETLSKRITELIERPDAARQMGKSARKTVSENFSLRAMARQYEEMYEAVLGSRNKA